LHPGLRRARLQQKNHRQQTFDSIEGTQFGKATAGSFPNPEICFGNVHFKLVNITPKVFSLLHENWNYSPRVYGPVPRWVRDA